MSEQFLFQDIYHKGKKFIVKSSVLPLSCYVCKKELNGRSITAKIIDGKTVFLCSHHYEKSPYRISITE